MTLESFEALIADIKEYLKTESNLAGYADRLKSYHGLDWQKYIKFSDDCYHREIVYQCDKFDVMIISWKQGQGSQIHDHPDQGCLMTILKGELTEKIYTIKDQLQNLSYVKVNDLSVGQIGYKQGSQCLHQIEAPIESISLHIYSPSRYCSKIYEHSKDRSFCGSD